MFINGYYSNFFAYIGCDDDNTHLVEFWSNNEESKSRIRLACSIDNPQSKTKKEEYVDSNGYVQTLSKVRRKEYDLTTDFYPDSLHDAIKEILIYPHLLVDGVLVYEAGDYSIGWDEKDGNGNAKATTTLAEQGVNKFSICE